MRKNPWDSNYHIVRPFVLSSNNLCTNFNHHDKSVHHTNMIRHFFNFSPLKQLRKSNLCNNFPPWEEITSLHILPAGHMFFFPTLLLGLYIITEDCYITEKAWDFEFEEASMQLIGEGLGNTLNFPEPTSMTIMRLRYIWCV